MAQFSETDWPVLRVHVENPQSAEDLEQYLAGLEACLARGERFGVLGTSGGSGAGAPGAARRQMAWMQENAGPLGRLLAGMAAVVPAARIHRDQTRGASLSTRLPFPMQAFDTEEAATIWLTGLITAVPAPGESLCPAYDTDRKTPR